MVDVQPNPTVYVGGNRFVCEFDTIHINSSVTPNWYTGYTYSWSPTTSLDFSNTPTVVFTAGVTQKYILTVSTSAGCFGKDSAQLIVQPGNFGGITPDFSVCPRDSALITGTGGGSYHWYPSLYLNDSLSATPWVKPIGSMHYKLIVTSTAGCHDTLSVNVHVHPGALLSLEDSVTLYPGETVSLSPTTNCSSFVWFPLAGLNNNTVSNPVASPDVDTKYFVHGVTSDGCIATDSISVHISSESLLTLPNAFAPGTGINKIFSVIKRGEATLNYFRIFNRWGNVVFETKDINEGWDGTYNGAPQPLGVYVYDVQAVTNSGKLFNKRGNVTLLR
jgi:gliding motility-associated-like protein